MNVSKRLKKGQLQTQIGTPYYMSPEIWHNRPYDSSSDMWALGCMIYELCSLRPPFLGNSFPELKRAVAAGRYTPLPKKYSDALHTVVRHLLRLNPKERPSANDLLRCSDVQRKLHLDGPPDQPLAAAADQASFPSMIDTIKVPQNLKKLGSVLPKACYSDARPNSPGAWIVSEQRIPEEPAPIQRIHRAPPPVPVVEKENSSNVGNAKAVVSIKDDKYSIERRVQALKEAGNRPTDLYSVPEQVAIVGPPGQPQYARAGAPAPASYMPHYEGVGQAAAYQRGRYKPTNLVPAPPPPSHRMW